MVKIVMIGAGSHVFTANLVGDFLSWPELRDGTITLVDIDEERLELIKAYTQRLVDQNGFKTKVEATSDRRKALEGADYVTLSIRVGGLDANRLDIGIPAKYGIYQGIGDTVGPGGVFYGLRHIPVILEICRDIEEVCPDALLLNYTNPMAMITWAINDHTRVRNIGLCHSVQSTSKELAAYLGAPLEEITYRVAGINHMAWFLKLEWNGEDAYPLLREKFKDPAVYDRPDAHWAGHDVARVEIFKAFGYFVTESSQHMSEYVPYFRKRLELLERFRLDYRLDTFDDFAVRRAKAEEDMKETLERGAEIPLRRTTEYCTYIIHSIETGTPRRVNVNVRNTGLITNLPEGCVVEVPCLVDETGIHPTYVGDLPPQCAALDRTNINVQELGALAAVEKDKELAFQAILLDPLTSALLTIDETRRMVDEMFEAEARYLQGFR
jgi:alpha-galactosidase